MSEYLTEHWVLSIFVTILLGAIGSGLWDAALKPVTRKLGGVLFTMLTFGAKRARDKIYKGASMGHHELPSLYILLICLSIGIAALISSQIRLYAAVYAPELTGAHIVEKCIEKEAEKQKECIREAIKEKMTPTVQILSLLATFICVVFGYRFAAVNRMNLVTTYYGQCLKAVRPFLTEAELFLIEQRYALMTTKEDYDEIIRQMAAVAKTNSASLPESYL
jgi:hypothetical protein